MTKVDFEVLSITGKDKTTEKLKGRYILIVTTDKNKARLAKFQRDVYVAAQEILGTDNESDTLTYALAVTAKVAEMVNVGNGVGYGGLIASLSDALAGPGTVEETKGQKRMKAVNPDKKKELVAV